MAIFKMASARLSDGPQSGPEKRRHRRVAYVSPGRISDDQPTDGGVPLPVEVIDISCGGVGFHAASPVQPGRSVELHLANNWMIHPATMRVAWCRPRHDGSYEAGAVFEPIAA